MTARSISLLGLALMPLLAIIPPACDDEEDCPAGYEGCACTDEYTCLDGLDCLSEYCVSPNASGNSGGESNDPSDGDGDSGSTNNVEACEAFIDSLDCGLPDGLLDCSIYAGVTCDVTDYLDCLTDNSSCTNDTIDATGWVDCVSFVEDCA